MQALATTESQRKRGFFKELFRSGWGRLLKSFYSYDMEREKARTPLKIYVGVSP